MILEGENVFTAASNIYYAHKLSIFHPNNT